MVDGHQIVVPLPLNSLHDPKFVHDSDFVPV
jgi:hypothetical protein